MQSQNQEWAAEDIRSSILSLSTVLSRGHVGVLLFAAATGIPFGVAIFSVLNVDALWEGIRVNGILLDLSPERGYRRLATCCRLDRLSRKMRRSYTVNLALQRRRLAKLIGLELLEGWIKLLLVLSLPVSNEREKAK